MQPDPILLSPSPPPSDTAAVGAIACLFLLIFLGGVFVGCAMGKRDRRLREAGQEKFSRPVTEAVKRVAGRAIRYQFGLDLPQLPPDWQTDIYGAAFEHCPSDGRTGPIEEAMMSRAAKDAYRALVASQAAMTTEEEE